MDGKGLEESATRSFYRYMSEDELLVIQQNGMLRGGNPGPTYWSTDLYTSATQAKSRLALPRAPEVRVEFRIKNEPALKREADPVAASMVEPGGGTEYMTTERVHVEVIQVDNLD